MYTDIELIQHRFHQFKLTSGQALRIYYHEEEKSIYESGFLFSPWEELDHDLHFFRSILNKEQFLVYEQELKKKMLLHENNLVAEDNNKEKEIAYYLELLKYYTTTLLPSLTDIKVFPFFSLIFSNRSKFDYLKTEYKKFVQYSRKDLLVYHFRNYRQFMPNQLKVSLLKHSLHFYFPDYPAFYHQMDAPTKSMAQYFEAIVCRLDKDSLQAIKDIFYQLDIFSNNINEKYLEEQRGWHVDIKQSEEQTTLNCLMAVLLIDKDLYEIDKYKV